ncbi:MAG: hypothetical protein IKE69_13030 [Thermoguttaceae bacterium]|nr:hypothetical protein [Thermoguttaceae bacterium]
MAKFNFFSLNELLASPRLRPVVERLHPAAVTAIVKGVYEDVIREMSLAAAERRTPELAELTDKILARLQDVERKENSLLIDASGVLFSSPRSEPHLSRRAIDEMIWRLDASISGFDPDEDEQPINTELGMRELFPSTTKIAADFCSLTGVEDVIFFGSPQQAELALIRAYCCEKKLGIARRDLYEDSEGNRFADRLFLPNRQIREVGASNKARLADFLEICQPETGLFWLASGVHSDMIPTLEPNELTFLRDNARLYSIPVVGRFDFAPIISLSNDFSGSISTISELNLLDYDLILTSGAQLIGGPNCGIIAGRKAYLQPLRQTKLDHLFAPNCADLAGFAETLNISRSRDRAEQEIPIIRMVTGPKANLMNRAERLAPQLAATKAIATAEPILCKTLLYPSASNSQLSSAGIRLSPAKNNAKELKSFLERGKPGLKGTVEDDTIIIDLRTVLPRWDQVILTIFEKLYG